MTFLNNRTGTPLRTTTRMQTLEGTQMRTKQRRQDTQYNGPLYRTYISKCGKYSWGYSTVVCSTCVGKLPTPGQKACYCEPVRCGKRQYDEMWSHYLLIHSPRVHRHRMPRKPGPIVTAKPSGFDPCGSRKGEACEEGGGANITPVEPAPPGPEPEWCTCGWDEVSLFFRCKRCAKNAKGYVKWVERVFG